MTEDSKETSGWVITVKEKLPDAPSPEAVFVKLASPTTWKDWRSESNQASLAEGVTEPIPTGGNYSLKIGFLWVNVDVTSCSNMCFETKGSAFFGLVQATGKFSVKKEGADIVVELEERQTGWIKPPKDGAIRANKLMIEELNKSFQTK
jgi:hypothetical protein